MGENGDRGGLLVLLPMEGIVKPRVELPGPDGAGYADIDFWGSAFGSELVKEGAFPLAMAGIRDDGCIRVVSCPCPPPSLVQALRALAFVFLFCTPDAIFELELDKELVAS